ncbi:hypothetical protein EXIGLDRAFT_777640 [Exidia glandulosa HHB12029]|uniref:Uncharacterized protein n=1 Tax=Exidia glandulosa HHB12029 TaxID=1314781 RepID=A0A165CX81_EXIGL|nr:hypothetical protein EXIGLDRAFT_777640 [Exidia glandulosa HHB12029]
MLAILCYLSLAAAVLLTAGAVFAVFSLHEAAQSRSAKENVSRGAKALTAITGKLQTIVRIPDSLALPVTATVYPARPTCTGRSCAPRFSIDDTDSHSDTGSLIQFALTDSELSITRDTNNSFRALYDFQRGSAVASFLPTNASAVINSTATFSHTKLAMHVALPLPWNRTVSITHPDWNIFTPPTPRNEIMLRAVNRARGRMCIASFDRNNVEELAPLALPLGLVMHSARPQTPRSAWRMMRQSLWS